MKSSTTTAVFTWDASAPREIADALKVISRYIPALKGGRKAAKLFFKKGKDAARCSAVRNEDGSYTITYGKMNMALRMVGNIVSGIVPEEAEYCPFNMFGIMLDCSRNAVMTPEHMKSYFAHLAILGYNMIMLYTEDTYQIPELPFFGYMRGALSPKEIREMDSFCAGLGMEMIPCIQTLGHLAQALQRGPENLGVKEFDTGDILLAGADDTYRLIERMLLAWKGNVRSKRIHLGMDETHQIGRGRYYDLNGDVPHVKIFNEHLKKVMELCKKHGFKPMIWSDMYFRLASKTHDYYDRNCRITKEVINMIPKGIELVYWDYYHREKDFYTDFIARHRELAGEPLMGSGVWTWSKLFYDREITEGTVVPCLEACRESKVRDVFFTMWGDDGGYCDYDSAMAGLAFSSELAFTGKADTDILNRKFQILFDGASYDNVITASDMETAVPESLIFDDPLMFMHSAGQKYQEKKRWAENRALFEKISRKLTRAPKTGCAGDLRRAKHCADAALAKMNLCDALLDTYFAKGAKPADMKKVLPLVDDCEKKMTAFSDSFRDMWLRNNKPFGFETMQIRFAGQIERLRELRRRLAAYISGADDTIPEFDELKRAKFKTTAWGYRSVSHASVII